MDQKLQKKLTKRIEEGTLRSLSSFDGYIDFFSNDYLGFSKLKLNFTDIQQYSSTGSRLISGTSSQSLSTEKFLAAFFKAEAALIFNSGYDANIGFFGSIPQRGDTVLYDELIHASIRDGIRLSFADSVSFKHNDFEDLKTKLNKISGVKYVVIESLYSMDGDIAPLLEFVKVCKEDNVYLIVDEAHACGVFGENGKGLISQYNLDNEVFVRIITFGKAFGSHGACVVGEKSLITYLINFSRSFIYTTALSPESYNRIKEVLRAKNFSEQQELLQENIFYFRSNLKNKFCISDLNSPIQLIKIGEIEKTKQLATQLQHLNIAVKPIFSPTVPIGSEGLRICFHSFNTKVEIDLLVAVLNG